MKPRMAPLAADPPQDPKLQKRRLHFSIWYIVAAIFLVGAGGERFAEGHVADTIALARRLPLDAADLVYLSPFVPTGGIDVLDPAEIERQLARLREAIRGAHPPVRIARYDLREFLY